MWYCHQQACLRTVLSAVGNTGSEWSVLRGAHVEAQMSVGSFMDESWTGMVQ